MHNVVWLAVAITVGLFLFFISGGIFAADLSSFWTALGAIGTLGAWYFLYGQSKAANEQMRMANEQLRIAQISTYRIELEVSIDFILQHILEDGRLKLDRVSWIAAALEVENLRSVINMLPKDLRTQYIERYGRMLDSKLPKGLFGGVGPRKSLLDEAKYERHRNELAQLEPCTDFPRREDLMAVYLFSHKYLFLNDIEPNNEYFDACNFFHFHENLQPSQCLVCNNIF